jgi:hypothetical protein
MVSDSGKKERPIVSSQLSRIVRRFWKRPEPSKAPSSSPSSSPNSSARCSPEAARAHQFCRRWTLPEAPDGPIEPDTSARSGPLNPLWRHFDGNREGPGIWKWEHYFGIYHRHLAKFVGSAAHIVEVGVYSGGSLGMWRDYFGPRCRISGIDIEEACRIYARPGIEIFIGDQADRHFWSEFRQVAPPIDVVLDDGGHEPEQQMVTLEETLPHLRPGGVYVCEDIHGVGNRFAAFASGLADHLNAAQWRIADDSTECDATPYQATVHSVHCYPFVVVIETHAVAMSTLRSTKRGTQWQPFL